MVALEAWALGRPVVVNGRCDVLKGQCIRSNAGLWYDGYAEFAATVRSIEKAPRLGSELGANGRRFFSDHYAWPVIEHKYLDLFARLKEEPARQSMQPLPSRLRRLRRDLPAARDVMSSLPQGPAVTTSLDVRRPAAEARR
jgi:hypothetical protein